MSIITILLVSVVGLLLVALGLYGFSRWLQKREPYRSFMQLKLAQKVSFFRRLYADPRVPWYVKIVPIVMALYVASPIDLIPDFIPVVGYLDDVAVVLASVALIIRFTPRPVIAELLGDLGSHGEGL